MPKTTKKTTKKRATRKKAKALTNEPVTISELQSWLSGVVEFQEANWTPNAEQWASIMNKIQNLVNDSSTQNQYGSSENSAINPEPHVQPQNHNPNQPVVNPKAHRKSYMNNDHGQQAVNQPMHESPAPPDAPLPPGKTVVVSNRAAPKASEVLPKIDNNGQPQSSFK